MAISSITEWLNGDRLYSVGVKLYLIHGKNSFFKKILEQGYSRTVHERLVRELTLLEHQEAEPGEPVEGKKFALPADLQELKDNLNAMYSELRLIHAELPKQVNSVTRRDMCLKILRDFQTIDAGYELINFYEATGRRPVNEVKTADGTFTLKRIIDGIKQIPVNISKTKTKLKAETDPGRITLLNDRIAAWESEYATIDHILKTKGDVVIFDAQKDL